MIQLIYNETFNKIKNITNGSVGIIVFTINIPLDSATFESARKFSFRRTRLGGGGTSTLKDEHIFHALEDESV